MSNMAKYSITVFEAYYQSTLVNYQRRETQWLLGHRGLQ